MSNTPIGLPRVTPTGRIVTDPVRFWPTPATRMPVKSCNTCRFERTPTAQSPCDACVDTPEPSQWRPK